MWHWTSCCLSRNDEVKEGHRIAWCTNPVSIMKEIKYWYKWTGIIALYPFNFSSFKVIIWFFFYYLFELCLCPFIQVEFLTKEKLGLVKIFSGLQRKRKEVFVWLIHLWKWVDYTCAWKWWFIVLFYFGLRSSHRPIALNWNFFFCQILHALP